MRVCVLKTKNGVFTRPIQKLYPLEIDVCSEECKGLREKSLAVNESNVAGVKNESKNLNDESKECTVVENKDIKCNVIDNKKKCKAKDSVKVPVLKEQKPKIVTTRSGREIKKPVRY